MTPEFWQNAWKNQQTGFNQSKPNAMLMQYFKYLAVPKQGCVFVPLCGQSIDMLWLLSEGYDVVGVELSKLAVSQFFADHNISVVVTPHLTQPNMTAYQACWQEQTITIWVGDFFNLSSHDIGHIHAIYDRGALVALPDHAPERMRWQYTQHLGQLTNYASQLLLAFSYDKKESAEIVDDTGLPPFLITSEQLDTYYGAHYQIQLVAKEYAEYVSTRGDSGYRLGYLLNSPIAAIKSSKI